MTEEQVIFQKETRLVGLIASIFYLNLTGQTETGVMIQHQNNHVHWEIF